ncbi:MAG TPA: 50S ribosomal protein L32 [Candidatus Absconditabacterales bacterium]|nr:50S ribosomal protein L32 [Candidatus Absconditabacterales bacterium]
MAGISPRKKISKHKSRTRHSTRERLALKKLSKKYSTSKCNNCGKTKLSHRVCPHCGYYKGKQVITIKSKSKDTVVDA